MLSNLSSLMGVNDNEAGTKGPGAPVPGSMPAAEGDIQGMLSNMMSLMPAGGIQGLSKAVIGMLVKVLQGVGVAYDVGSQEGKFISSAIRNLTKISGGQQTGDMKTLIQSLLSTLPPDMQKTAPGQLGSAIQGLLGNGGPGSAPPPGGGAPPAGGAPPPGPMAGLMQ